KGNLDRAEELLKRALELAKAPSEWRTRGRSRYDLALLYHIRDRPTQAQAILVESLREGFRPHKLARGDADMEAILELAEKQWKSGGKVDLSIPKGPQTVSLFALDGVGEI